MSPESCNPVQTSPIDRHDLTIIADFSAHSDDCWRVGEEVRCASGAGYSVGLVNIADANARVHPDIASCLFEGHAVPASLDGWIETRLLLIATPDRVGKGGLQRRPHIRAGGVLAIVPDLNELKGELLKLDARLRFFFGEVAWTAYDAATLAELSKLVPNATETWPAVVTADGAGRRRPGSVIGTICFGPTSEPALSVEGFRTLSLGPQRSPDGFSFDEITLRQFLAKVNYLACFEEAGALPVTAIGKALEMHIPVLLPPSRRASFGEGPTYVRREDLPQRLHQLRKQSRAVGGSTRSRLPSKILCTESEFFSRLLRLLGATRK